MKLVLPKLSRAFDIAELNRTLPDILGKLSDVLGQTRKSDADVELAGAQRLILTDTVTGDRVSISVASGVVTITTL